MATPSIADSDSRTTRVVVHADDVGMNHGANQAFIELSGLGTIGAGSVMVPCPWFSEIGEAAAASETLDCGVHLTLNSEMTHYRWAPITRVSAASGLIDDDGYMWPDVASLRRHANPDAVETEWRAQIERALAAGIDVTHLDAHMGSALAPEWCDRYVSLGIEYRVPVLLTARLGDYGPGDHLEGADEAPFVAAVEVAHSAGLPIFDEVLETDFSRPDDQSADYVEMLSDLAGDLIYCAFHPNTDGEIRNIEPDSCHVRIDEHLLFGRPEWKDWLDAQPFELCGMRELRSELRATLNT